MNQTSSLEWWRPREAERFLPAAEIGEGENRTHGRFAFWALLAFTFVLVFAPQNWVPALAPFRLALLAAAAATVGHLVDRFQRRAAYRTPAEFVIAGGLLAWAVLTAPFSLWPGGTVSEILDVYLKSLVVFWLLGRVVNTTDRLYKLGWTLSLLSVPIALSGLANYGAGVFLSDSQRIQGYGSALAGNPNDLALTLDIFLPITLALLVTAQALWLRALAGGIALLSLVGIIVTFSRGGFVGLAVIGFLACLWMVRRKPALTIGAVVSLVLVAPPLLPAGYVDRLATTFNIESDTTNSAQERVRDMKAAVEVVQQRPIMGAGLGMDAVALNQVRGSTWRKVHDVYLEYAVDLGLIGLILFLLLLASSILTARRVEREGRARGLDDRLAAMAAGVRISLTGFAVAAFFYPVAYYFYFYYLAGLAVALRTIRSAKS
jgi:putative inorganic carbon (hco3(-)) transporter